MRQANEIAQKSRPIKTAFVFWIKKWSAMIQAMNQKTIVYQTPPSDFHPSQEVASLYLEVNGSLLLLLRAKEKPDGARWGVPAGKVEPNEAPLSAAIRELREETGIIVDVPLVRSIGTLYVRKPDLDYTFHMFSVLLKDRPSVLINQEHQDFRWAKAHEIEEMSLVPGGKEAYRHFCAIVHQAKKRGFNTASAYLILQKGDHVLLGLRKNTGYSDGLWGLPAGHVEDGETAREAMAREAKEELGITIDPKHLIPAHVIHRQSNRINIDFFFSCSKWDGEIENRELEKCEKLQFFPLSNLPENSMAYNKTALAKLSQGEFYSELGWD